MKFIFIKFLLNVDYININLNLIARIIFIIKSYYNINFFISFILNYNIRFNNYKKS